jgi:hypothetical protein
MRFRYIVTAHRNDPFAQHVKEKNYGLKTYPTRSRKY